MNAGTRAAVAVTGGASGIGLETCRLLGERGYAAFPIDLDPDAVARACADLGIPAERGIACDVTDEAAVEAAHRPDRRLVAGSRRSSIAPASPSTSRPSTRRSRSSAASWTSI